MKRRPIKEAKRLAKEWYGLEGKAFEELKAYLIEQKEMSTQTWFQLDAVGLVGPSGSIMADALSIFYSA